MCAFKIINKDVIKATEEYLSRKDRKSHPDGSFDKSKRWYPSDVEECEACSSIRSPSRAYPFSLMTHCRSIGHIAAKHKVNATVMRKISGEVVRTAKCGQELSVLGAAEMIVDNNKDYIAEQGLFSDEISPEHRMSTTQAKPVGGAV